MLNSSKGTMCSVTITVRGRLSAAKPVVRGGETKGTLWMYELIHTPTGGKEDDVLRIEGYSYERLGEEFTGVVSGNLYTAKGVNLRITSFAPGNTVNVNTAVVMGRGVGLIPPPGGGEGLWSLVLSYGSDVNTHYVTCLYDLRGVEDLRRFVNDLYLFAAGAALVVRGSLVSSLHDAALHLLGERVPAISVEWYSLVLPPPAAVVVEKREEGVSWQRRVMP